MREELAQEIISLARAKNARVVAVESCTGGLISHSLTQIPGASEVFWAGIVTYAETAKTALADVPRALIEHHGAVSSEVAEAMARGGLEKLRMGAEVGLGYSVASTGIAGPGGGTIQHPVGTCWVAVAVMGSGKTVRVRSRKITLSSEKSRAELKEEFTVHALGELLKAVGGAAEEVHRNG